MSIRKPLSWVLIVISFIFPLMARGQILADKYSRIVELGSCKYKVEGLTKGEATSAITATLDMAWSMNGTTTNITITDRAFVTKSGIGSTTAEFNQTYDLDYFDDYDALITGKHSLNGQVLHNTGENKWVVCQYYAGNDDGCTEVIAKAVGDTPCNHSPIVLDLDNDGFAFSGPEGAVAFDLYGTEVPIVIQWVTPGEDDAFLVRDGNRNGIVDDGSELFGNGTPLILDGNRHAPNGFVALAQFDDPVLGGNDDGLIDADDLIWLELSLWLDGDANGLCDPDELIDLDAMGLESLAVVPRETNWWDDHQNWLRYLAWAQGEKRHLMVDVFFREVR